MIHELRAALLGISSYRALMEEPLMGSVRRLLDALVKNRGEEALEAYTDVFYRLRREGNMGLGEWIWDKLRYLESPYPTALGTGVCDPALESAARRDIETLALLAGLDCDRLISSMAKRLAEEFAPVLAGLPRWRAGAPFTFQSLTEFYRVHGAGRFARYRAFLWSDGALIPVADPDCPAEEEMLAVLNRELRFTALKQLFVTAAVLSLEGTLLDLLPLGFNDLMHGYFRTLCVGYGLYAIGNTVMLILLYFTDYLGAVLASGVFAAAAAVGTVISLFFDQAFYGFGFLAGAAVFFLLALLRLDYYTSSLPYRVLGQQPIVAQTKSGRFTKLALFLEKAAERGESDAKK